MQKTRRERAFAKAWALDFSGGESGYLKRLEMQEQLCNALAYYVVLCDRLIDLRRPLNTASSHIGIRISRSIETDGLHAAMKERIDAQQRTEALLTSLDQSIEDDGIKAIKLYLIDNGLKKDVGLKFAFGRSDPNAASHALQHVLSRAGKALFLHFNRFSDDHEFRKEWTSAEALGLSLRVNNRAS